MTHRLTTCPIPIWTWPSHGRRKLRLGLVRSKSKHPVKCIFFEPNQNIQNLLPHPAHWAKYEEVLLGAAD